MSRPSEARVSLRAVLDATPRELLVALVHGWCLGAVVPLALARVERDPLASAGCFAGDIMRGLMDVPGGFWGRHPRLYDRYRAALRASAALRRRLPYDERMQFWSPLDPALPDAAELPPNRA
jgi:hypothetical protein